MLTPQITGPLNGSTTFDVTPTLSWTDEPHAASYEVWLSVLGQDPHAIYIQDGIAGNSATIPFHLTLEDHRLWVRSFDGAGNPSPWSSSSDFAVTEDPPSGLAADVDVSGQAATLSWDSLGGAATYTVWLSEVGYGQTQLVEDIGDTSLVVSGLTPERTFRFWVQGETADSEQSNWSTSFDFQTPSPFASEQPTLTGPAAVEDSSSVALTWDAVPAADSYTVWVSEIGLGQIQLEEGVQEPYLRVSDLPRDKNYRFWVQAVNANGTLSQWSTSRDFTLNLMDLGSTYTYTTNQTTQSSLIPSASTIRVGAGVTLTLHMDSSWPASVDNLIIDEGATLDVRFFPGSSQILVDEFVVEPGARVTGDHVSINAATVSVRDNAVLSSTGTLNLTAGTVDLGLQAALYTSNWKVQGVIGNAVVSKDTADSDYDDLSDLDEFYAGTYARNADTDGDWLIDGFEVLYNLDPLAPDDRTTDVDSDGMTLLREQIFWTNPQNADTDGDGATDLMESNTGANPTDATDGGVSPSAEEKVTLRLTVGDHSASESERYILQVGHIRHQSEDFGSVATTDYILRLDRTKEHEIRVIHVGSNIQPPDYDYLAALEVVQEPVDGFHFCLHDPDTILRIHQTNESEFYAANREAILVAYAVAEYEWHHLLARKFQTEFETVFQGTGLSIHDDIYGLIIPFKDHRAMHPAWEDEWGRFWQNRNPATTTVDEVEEQMRKMMEENPRFKGHIAKGSPAHVSHSQWGTLGKHGKSAVYDRLRAGKKLLGISLAVAGGAQTASAALSPALAFGDEDVLLEYRAAIAALSQCDYHEAHQHIFGITSSDDENNPVFVLESNPPGVVPKILKAQFDANNLSRNGVFAAFTAAVNEFREAMADIDCHCPAV
jgi:hypothetical protein